MKFSKEELQKVVFIAIILVAFLWVYNDLLLGGISKNERDKNKIIADLQPMIKAAHEQLQRTKVLEGQAASVDETLDQIKGLIPNGAPVAWFPPRITDFFKRQGIEKASIQQNGDSPDKDLGEDFRKLAWTIDLPKLTFAKLGIAVAGLENEEPLLEISRIQIGENREDPISQGAILNIVTIMKK